MLLAPQHGNDTDDKFGTISIEVLTTTSTEPELWNRFKQTIADIWTSYKDENGVPVNARPHWAKEWEGIKVHNRPIKEYLRDAYKGVLPQFRETFGKIVTDRDGSVAETRARFGNNLMEEILFD